MTTAIPIAAEKLLDFIASFEAPRGYNTIYGNRQGTLPRPITSMNLNEVLASQPQWSARFGSSAAGRYQFMRATLAGLKAELGLAGTESFSPDLQDRLAYQLLLRRGYQKFVSGVISLEGFALNLAKEWASLPVLRSTQGAHRMLTRGQSFYCGDSLNHALVAPDRVEAVLREVHAAAISGASPPAKPEVPIALPVEVEQPRSGPMNDGAQPKPWYLSKGVIGGILAVGTPIASIFFPPAAMINPTTATDWIMRVVEVGGPIAGGLLAILGRVQARGPISLTRQSIPETFLRPGNTFPVGVPDMGLTSSPGLEAQMAEVASGLRLVVNALNTRHDLSAVQSKPQEDPVSSLTQEAQPFNDPVGMAARQPNSESLALLGRLVEIAPRLIELAEQSSMIQRVRPAANGEMDPEKDAAVSALRPRSPGVVQS